VLKLFVNIFVLRRENERQKTQILTNRARCIYLEGIPCTKSKIQHTPVVKSN